MCCGVDAAVLPPRSIVSIRPSPCLRFVIVHSGFRPMALEISQAGKTDGSPPTASSRNQAGCTT
jgi:hypothetical protein